VVPQRVIVDQAQLLAFEAQVVALGYEGVMVRSMFSLYKWGVSTIQEGGLLKIKRFHDAEAVIVGYTEELCNNNEPTLSETGRTKRSTHRVNKVGKNRLGAWIVTGLTAFPGITFRVGTGLTTKQRIDFWLQRETDIGKIIKFNYFTVGAKNAPRNPVYAGFRDRIDM
jgi:DNA ligase-1